MDLTALLRQWLDTLAGLVESARDGMRERRAIKVTVKDDLFTLHSNAVDGLQTEPLPLAVLASGTRAADEVLKGLRGKFILLDYPASQVITRHLSAPAQARDFLAGVVRNQIDRLSPWPATQILYGYQVCEATSDKTMLDIVISIASRSEVEALRSRFAETGLAADRVVVSPASLLPVALWSKSAPSSQQADPRKLRLAIGGGLGGLAAISLALCIWGMMSIASIQEESEDALSRLSALQKREVAQRSPQMLAGLPPARRAWVAKEIAVPMSLLLEALSRSVPDGAYLSELSFGEGKVRVSGLADEAPPLIGALEGSHQFSDVHFTAPITRGQDGRLARFSIEARVDPKLSQGLKN